MPKRKKTTGTASPFKQSPEEQALAAAVEALLPEPLTPADHVAFALLSAKLTEWLALNHVCREKGVTEFSPRNKTTHLSPEARREAEVFAEVVSLCKEFGMTPRSRARMAAALGREAAAQKAPTFCGFISADPGKPAE